MRFMAMLLFLCLFGGVLTVYALDAQYIYVIEGEADETGSDYLWRMQPAEIPEECTPEEEAYWLFTYLFETAECGVPEGVRVLGVLREDGCLTVNVSGEMLRYGGTANEQALIAQCKKTALSLPEVESFTLLIDGLLQSLPEGRLLEAVTADE